MKDVKRMEEKTDEVCDKCGSPMVIKWGRYGKFLACSGYPECKNTRQLAGGGRWAARAPRGRRQGGLPHGPTHGHGPQEGALRPVPGLPHYPDCKPPSASCAGEGGKLQVER
jgi:DNA topoisomerase-1